MSLAKAAVTGVVYKEPKTGYTQNNIAVSSFVLNVGERDELLVRVISRKSNLVDVVSNLKKNQRIAVAGRLQMGLSKQDDGSDKKVFEIDAQSIDLIGGSAASQSDSSSDEEILKFGEMEMAPSSENTDVLIGEDEVPF